MNFPFQFQLNKNPKGHQVYIFNQLHELNVFDLPPAVAMLLNKYYQAGLEVINIPFENQWYKFIVLPKDDTNINKFCESVRLCGAKFKNVLVEEKIKEIAFYNAKMNDDISYAFLEGLCLSFYQFEYYKSETKKVYPFRYINIDKNSISPAVLKQLEIMIQSVFIARDLINEPPNELTATVLSERVKAIGKAGMVKVGVYTQSKIEQLGMGGILAVNKGSTEPATFTIIEHKPAKAVNKKPIVLIGKGVVYDTGGLSLKPTANSMDKMKSDMGGAAVVTSVMYNMGMMDVPLHIIALIPATDNRPTGNAYAPGDIIKMYSGQTVEVLNTDAEGRMILADALHFAKKYDPSLVITLATLTGAAANAIGDIAMVGMGNADQSLQNMANSGYSVNEKIAIFPFWDEYADQLKSDVADMKNIGTGTGGAITAGKFLEKFTDYPYIHLDIAGVTFRDSEKGYLTKGGTGVGIRMMTHYLLQLAKVKS